MPDETPIARAIRESREREEKATKGPWTVGAEPGHPMPWLLENMVNMPEAESRKWFQTDKPNDAQFIAAARTWEPRFRDALENAVYELEKIRRREGDTSAGLTAFQALAEISRIVQGRKTNDSI